MGIDYNFSLKVGFSVPEEEFNKLFLKTEEGSYHLEDRFDAKTGNKIQPEKIWDKKPITYFQIDDLRFDSIYNIVYEQTWLNTRLGCNIDRSDISYNVFGIDFHLPTPCKFEHQDFGKVSLTASPISLRALESMLPKLLELKQKLEELGLSPGEPRVFVSFLTG